MRSEASLGRGATAPPQAAVTQQVISRCVCLACGAFSKKSVRTGLRVVPGREEEEGNWLISSRFLLFCWSKSTEGWLPILGGGIIWPLVGPGEAETICCLSPMSHSEGQRSKGKGSAESMEATQAQHFSSDCPTVGGGKTRRQECLQQEGGALSNLRNA